MSDSHKQFEVPKTIDFGFLKKPELGHAKEVARRLEGLGVDSHSFFAPKKAKIEPPACFGSLEVPEPYREGAEGLAADPWLRLEALRARLRKVGVFPLLPTDAIYPNERLPDWLKTVWLLSERHTFWGSLPAGRGPTILNRFGNTVTAIPEKPGVIRLTVGRSNRDLVLEELRVMTAIDNNEPPFGRLGVIGFKGMDDSSQEPICRGWSLQTGPR